MSKNKFRVWCETDEAYYRVWDTEVPTECPDCAGTITASRTSIETVGDRQFGEAHSLGYSESESSTSSTSYLSKTSAVIELSEPGTFRITWYAEGKTSHALNPAYYTILHETTPLAEVSTESGSYVPIPGIALIDLEEGTHNFYFKYKQVNSGKTAYIRRARIELWRVG